MAQFIELTEAGGKPVRVNVDSIDFYFAAPDDELKTLVIFGSGPLRMKVSYKDLSKILDKRC